jgi:uncharacterized membrane protein
MSDSRLLTVDAARGTSMLLVCLSHFLLAISYASGRTLDPGLTLTITAVASPAFMTISGLIFGYLLAKAKPGSSRTSSRMVERALLLLIPVHVLVRLPHLLAGTPFDQVAQVIEITDTIAVAMLVNLMLVRQRSSVRLALAAAIFAVSWAINLLWQPAVPALVAVKDLLVRAAWDNQSVLHGFAFMPWLAVHLGATVLGEKLAAAERAGTLRTYIWRLALLGMLLVIAGVAAKAAEIFARGTLGLDRNTLAGAAISTLVSPFGKYPPAPGYLAFCGGAGLLLITAVFAVVERGWVPRVTAQLAMLGRASLGAWVVQAWLYWGLIPNLPLPPLVVLPLYALITFVVVWLGARAWDGLGLNRRLTLGLARSSA